MSYTLEEKKFWAERLGYKPVLFDGDWLAYKGDPKNPIDPINLDDDKNWHPEEIDTYLDILGGLTTIQGTKVSSRQTWQQELQPEELRSLSRLP